MIIWSTKRSKLHESTHWFVPVSSMDLVTEEMHGFVPVSSMDLVTEQMWSLEDSTADCVHGIAGLCLTSL